MAKVKKEHPVRSKEHWEMHYDTCPKGKITPATAFLPQRGRDRPQPHVKINETDH